MIVILQMDSYSVISPSAGEFGAVYEGIFSPQKGHDIRVAVKTLKGIEYIMQRASNSKIGDSDNTL